MRNWLISSLIAVFTLLQSDLSEAQARIPGWNRVAPPGGHQNDPQLVRATGGPVVPIFDDPLCDLLTARLPLLQCKDLFA